MEAEGRSGSEGFVAAPLTDDSSPWSSPFFLSCVAHDRENPENLLASLLHTLTPKPKQALVL